MTNPEVSIVIPIRNSEDYIERLLAGLRELEYQSSYEVIIVDNGSTDRTYEILRESEFKVLSCTEVYSSYAARNIGIKEAQYDIIAFTDADCRVSSNWLSNGVSHLQAEESDIAAGRVVFEFKDKGSSWEVYDSLVNMDNKYSVSRGQAKTANVFVRKSLFDQYRYFDGNAKSGEDVKWTNDMFRKGCKLSYCHDAVVYHPTRSKKETLEKAKRVGYGARHKYGLLFLLLFFVKGFLPPNPIKWNKLLHQKESSFKMFSIYVPVWRVSISQSWGILFGGKAQ